MPFARDEDDDDLYDSVVAMADRMRLKGPKRQEYIHDHMLQGGYEPVQTREAYARVQQEGDEEGGGQRGTRSWFSGGDRGGRSSGRSGRQRGDDDDNF
jgi:hypothetical protein